MKHKLLVLILSVFCLNLTACGEKVTELENDTVYECDVKLSARTKIITNLNGSEVTIKGGILRLIEDPLEMVNSDGSVLANADDDYNFINQDDHAIYVNDDIGCIVNGNFGFAANHYTIYNKDYEEIAKADFNATDTYGSIVTPDGVLWAEYSSGFFFNDYTIRVHEECDLSDEAVLMLMASYKSDRLADSD